MKLIFVGSTPNPRIGLMIRIEFKKKLVEKGQKIIIVYTSRTMAFLVNSLLIFIFATKFLNNASYHNIVDENKPSNNSRKPVIVE